MRIGIFTECYRPITNGVVVSIETFRRELLAHGHQVWVFTPHYQQYPDASIIPFRSLGLPSRTSYRCATPWPVKPPPPTLDVIHSHSPFSTGLLARTWARRYRCPLVFTYHTRLEDYAHYVPLPSGLVRRTMVWASRTYCNEADLVLAPSVEIQSLLRRYGVHRPIEVLPTAACLEGLEGADRTWLRRQYGWTDRHRILLTVGRLAPEKNLGFLVEAFARIHARQPETVLVVVGDGPDRARLERQVEDLGVQDAVRFAGMVARDVITHYYASADLFVFASVTETQGLVLGEALQAGTPVVAVGAGGVVDALRASQGSLTCEPDVDALANVVVDLLGDPPRLARLRDQAHALAGPSQAAESLLVLYQQVIERGRRPSPLWRTLRRTVRERA